MMDPETAALLDRARQKRMAKHQENLGRHLKDLVNIHENVHFLESSNDPDPLTSDNDDRLMKSAPRVSSTTKGRLALLAAEINSWHDEVPLRSLGSIDKSSAICTQSPLSSSQLCEVSDTNIQKKRNSRQRSWSRPEPLDGSIRPQLPGSASAGSSPARTSNAIASRNRSPSPYRSQPLSAGFGEPSPTCSSQPVVSEVHTEPVNASSAAMLLTSPLKQSSRTANTPPPRTVAATSRLLQARLRAQAIGSNWRNSELAEETRLNLAAELAVVRARNPTQQRVVTQPKTSEELRREADVAADSALKLHRLASDLVANSGSALTDSPTRQLLRSVPLNQIAPSQSASVHVKVAQPVCIDTLDGVQVSCLRSTDYSANEGVVVKEFESPVRGSPKKTSAAMNCVVESVTVSLDNTAPPSKGHSLLSVIRKQQRQLPSGVQDMVPPVKLCRLAHAEEQEERDDEDSITWCPTPSIVYSEPVSDLMDIELLSQSSSVQREVCLQNYNEVMQRRLDHQQQQLLNQQEAFLSDSPDFDRVSMCTSEISSVTSTCISAGDSASQISIKREQLQSFFASSNTNVTTSRDEPAFSEITQLTTTSADEDIDDGLDSLIDEALDELSTFNSPKRRRCSYSTDFTSPFVTPYHDSGASTMSATASSLTVSSWRAALRRQDSNSDSDSLVSSVASSAVGSGSGYVAVEDRPARIQRLIAAATQEKARIEQASNALSTCGRGILSGTSHLVECARVLLIACQRRQCYLEEADRLRKLTQQTESTADSTQLHGNLNISGLRLYLRHDFAASNLPNIYANRPRNSEFYNVLQMRRERHYYILLVRAPGARLIATEIVCAEPGADRDTLDFPNCLNLPELRTDFSVRLELYGISMPPPRCVVDSFDSDCSPLANTKLESSPSTQSIISASTPGSTNKNKRRLKAVFEGLLGSAGKNSLQKASRIKEATSTSTTSTGGFALLGTLELNLAAVLAGRSEKYPLSRLPLLCPLLPQLELCAHASASLPSRGHCGFVNWFEEVGGLGAWRRRWTTLAHDRLLYWMYPDQEIAEDEPHGWVELSSAVNRSAELAPRERCARPYTLELTLVRLAGHDEVDGLVCERRGAYMLHRLQLSCESRIEMRQWQVHLSQVLSALHAWHPARAWQLRRNAGLSSQEHVVV